MTTVDILLADVDWSAAAGVRGATDEVRVADAAQQLREGVPFPPAVVFVDSDGHHWGCDGHVRALAAARVGHTTLTAELRPGDKREALWHWFSVHPLRTWLAAAVRKQVVKVAIAAFPERSGAEIARQLGISHQWVSELKQEMRNDLQASCTLPDVVVGKDGRQYPAVRMTVTTTHPRTPDILKALEEGRPAHAIAAAFNVSSRTVASIRKTHGFVALDRSRVAVEQRVQQIRSMAGEGYTTRQIAAAVQLTGERVHEIALRDHIDITADRVVGKTQRHDSNRILSRIVMDAENLTAGANLIDYEDVDRTQLEGWLRSLVKSRAALSAFIKRLMQEHEHHGEAA